MLYQQHSEKKKNRLRPLLYSRLRILFRIVHSKTDMRCPDNISMFALHSVDTRSQMIRQDRLFTVVVTFWVLMLRPSCVRVTAEIR